MSKRTLSYASRILLVLILIGGAYFLLRPWWRLPFDRVHPLNAVIESAGVAVGIPNLLTPADTVDGMPWESDLDALNSLLTQTDIGSLQEWRSWWLVPQRGAEETVFTIIGDAEGRLASVWNTLEYGPVIEHEEGQIYSWPQAASARLYFTKYQNLLILGRLPLQVETALTALSSDQNWLQQPGLKKLLELPTPGNSLADWQLVIRTPDGKSSWPSLNAIPEWLPLTQQEDGWAMLALDQQDSLAHWQGYWVADTPVGSPSEPTETLLLTAPIPETAVQAITTSLPSSNSKQWQQYIAPWAGPELIFGQLNGYGRELGQQDFWLLTIEDTSTYRAKTEELIKQVGVTDRREYQAYTLQQTLSSELLQPLSDRRGLNPWWVQIDDYIVFSVSREVLERFVDYHILGGYLSQQSGFLDLVSLFSPHDKTTQYFYQQWTIPEGSPPLFQDQQWTKSGRILSRTDQYEVGVERIEAWVKAQAISSPAAYLDWSLNLAATLPLQLLPVLNEKRQVVGCLVQDADGQVWRLSVDGNIEWTSRASRLFAPTYELRFLENEMGLVAASTDQLYYWNTKGTPLPKFSHLTTAPATAPTVIQFSVNSLDWTLFQPTAAGNIMAINRDGSFLSPWNPLDSSGVLRYPLQHVQLPEKDFLVGIVDTGQWHVWSRGGEMRFARSGLNSRLIGGPQAQQLSEEVTDPENRWVVVDQTGRAQVLTYSGESFPLRLGRGPADRYLFSDAWGDERADFWIQRSSLLHLFAYEGTQLAERWQYRFDQPIDTLVAFDDQGALAVSNARQQLYLINGQGQLVPGFPLAGEGTAIPVWETSNARIITSVDATVYAYRWEK